ncbi:TPA: hypothetical protein QCV86_003022 [Bacillus thuringiensis]|nr:MULTISPECIES: hypothetical protein [Bacillus cereus group]KLA37183.1 hypothetical protein B4158_5685 [Bacillus cereus]MBU0451089.1 hypothetical protein [Bacillus thuringiensis]MCC3982925.1 hypothetical protein [Bacillus thuringiensis serovar kurstaki]MCR6840996.1 hypothetical protein [Bacillus thuringiensis]MCU5013294.1 hypothetical protein [Bacillus cereus]
MKSGVISKKRAKHKKKNQQEKLTLHDIKYLMGAYNPRCSGKTIRVIR